MAMLQNKLRFRHVAWQDSGATLLPLPAGQALALWPLAPIGPHVGADNAAAGADHARAEGTPA